MVFISSNSGTGKTTFFKWLFCRKAIKGKIKFDVFFRFENEIEDKFNVTKWLRLPPNASKRKQKLCAKLDIEKATGKEGDDYFLINKETKERIAQALCINTQRKVKSTENPILSNCAIFDEIMPDDNYYCPNEIYKFSRLIDTRARNRDYKVLGLYNNTNPYFPYKESFGKAGAVFIDFVGKKFGQPKFEGIQKILAGSDYGEIYLNNNFQYFKEFYREMDLKNKTTIFYISIQNHLFALKDCDEVYFLKPAKKIKKNREVYSIALEGNDYLMANSNLTNVLSKMINNRLLFVNNKKYTIFVKSIADFLNLNYNI